MSRLAAAAGTAFGTPWAEKMTGRRYDIPDVWYQQPIYYKGNRLTFIGNNQDVLWPDYADYLDKISVERGKETAKNFVRSFTDNSTEDKIHIEVKINPIILSK